MIEINTKEDMHAFCDGKGNTIVPDGSVFNIAVIFPERTRIGNDCTFRCEVTLPKHSVVGDSNKFEGILTAGSGCAFGDSTTFRSRVSMGSYAYIGDNVRIAGNSKLGEGCVARSNLSVGPFSTIAANFHCGDNATFDSAVEIGRGWNIGARAKFDQYCIMGDYGILRSEAAISAHADIGHSVLIDKPFTYAGYMARRVVTLANVDGSHRSVTIIDHADYCIVEAGCFRGTLDEFCARATEEAKLDYVRVVSAVCKALIEEH